MQSEAHFEEFVRQWNPSTLEFLQMEIRPFKWVVLCKPFVQELGRLFAGSGVGLRVSLSADFTFRWCHMNFSCPAAKGQKTIEKKARLECVKFVRSKAFIDCHVAVGYGVTLAVLWRRLQGRMHMSEFFIDMLYAQCSMN